MGALLGPLEDVHYADGAHADHVGDAESGVGLLADAGLCAELACHLSHLARTGRPDRMTHRQQAAGRAHRAGATDVEVP